MKFNLKTLPVSVRSFRVFLCLIPCLLSPLRAQPAGVHTTVHLRLVPLGMAGQIRGVGLWRQGTFEELWIPSTHFSKPVEYSGPNPITLFSMVANEEGEEIPVPVARAVVPADAREVLLLMAPLPPEKVRESVGETGAGETLLPDPPVRYGIKVVDFSPVSFPETSFMVWNLTGRPLVGTLEDKPFQVNNRRFVLLRPDIDRPKALDAKILYADDSSRASYTSRKWFLRPGQKTMIIMTADPGNPDGYLLRSIRYPAKASE